MNHLNTSTVGPKRISHDKPLSANGGIRPDPIPMLAVQQKVTAFHGKMQKLAKFLADSGASEDLLIDSPEEFMLQLYIDRPGLDRLVNISNQDGFSKLGVFFGVEDPKTQLPLASATTAGFGRLTCCFVGLDIDQKPLGIHFPSAAGGTAAVEAEDTWPPPPPPPPHPTSTLTLVNDANDVFDYFQPTT